MRSRSQFLFPPAWDRPVHNLPPLPSPILFSILSLSTIHHPPSPSPIQQTSPIPHHHLLVPEPSLISHPYPPPPFHHSRSSSSTLAAPSTFTIPSASPTCRRILTSRLRSCDRIADNIVNPRAFSLMTADCYCSGSDEDESRLRCR